MLDITNFGLFAFSVFLLSVTPGPDMAYVIGQSVANGRRAGIVSASGVALGSCTHAIAGTLGLTALITASPVMFTAIKYIGASYLIFLGGKMLLATFIRKKDRGDAVPRNTRRVNAYRLLSRGFITTLTNPKVLLFFISFFPQFVTPEGDQHAASFLLLGLTYAFIAFLTDVTFAIFAGSTAGAVAGNRKLQNLLDRIVGATFIALGIRLALTRR
ncbi:MULTISPECIES: LysE family translocator [Pantoea]|jgi:RhtB (resistance to homoserine/threonine) family protein|uniref:LysE family translocator n=1 Tax=Enterobacter agglomerans TaxID=549 RepID=A0AAN2FL65_ENTAG|nr:MULTISPECIES: LysE family translocator [Pantoea]KOA71245.1 lysine transporter LysE [Pantoea sp. CFSAN033090]NYB31522.1 LysE family translocator [Pantoea agglomerans]CAH6376972.1 LysE family translocator [Pantoea agglomerans]